MKINEAKSENGWDTFNLHINLILSNFMVSTYNKRIVRTEYMMLPIVVFFLEVLVSKIPICTSFLWKCL